MRGADGGPHTARDAHRRHGDAPPHLGDGLTSGPAGPAILTTVSAAHEAARAMRDDGHCEDTASTWPEREMVPLVETGAGCQPRDAAAKPAST